MSLNMFVQEVRVQELGVSPGTADLVHKLFLVEELVSDNTIVTGEEAPFDWEPEELHESLRSHVEIKVVKLYVIAEQDQLP